MEKLYLKEQREIIGKLVSNITSNIKILPSALKYVSIECADQCIQIVINKETLNVIKGVTKIQKI